jgi:single-strand selective monofunctional uracil DNA glycosylase
VDLVEISRRLGKRAGALAFAAPVTYVYNPLVYARAPHELYLARHGQRFAAGAGRRGSRVLLVGMNPGPFGMAQTGVPFGDVAMVRDFLGIEAPVKKPPREHPARPVTGFACPRAEVSGTRLWGWARDRFGTAERFFERFFVANYCPLAFMEEGGRNRTPDKLPPGERNALLAVCDEALRALCDALQPTHVIGVGGFAEDRAREALPAGAFALGCILHPSPASPAANRDWGGQVDRQLRDHGVTLP